MYLRNRPRHVVGKGKYDPADVFPGDLSLKFLSNLLNNFATATNIISDEGLTAIPGAMIASPSREEDPETDQNYVYDWTRDSALTIIEMSHLVEAYPELKALMLNYFYFVKSTFKATAAYDQAKWCINGFPYENWTKQGDGAGIRILALYAIQKHIQRDIDMKDFNDMVEKYLNWILNNFDNETTNIWEEARGRHFYTYAINHAALTTVQNRPEFAGYKAKMIDVLEKIKSRKAEFCAKSYFKSNISSATADGNDLNIDTIFALYESDGFGEDFSSDTSLKTLGKIAVFFKNEFKINAYDEKKGYGINVGRYPFDRYDGDMSDGINTGHPWFISTLIVATYLYKVIAEYINKNKDIVIDDKNLEFFSLSGITKTGTLKCKSTGYNNALKQMMKTANRQIFSVRFHSDGAHLSEQYDKDTGYMKSVRDLSWSYKEYFTALRESKKAYAALSKL
jgi:glucoamylase